MFFAGFGGFAVLLFVLMKKDMINESTPIDVVKIVIIIFGAFALFMAYLTVKEISDGIKRAKTKQLLLETGSRVTAQIVGAENANITVNGRTAQRLICRFTENNLDRDFKSDMILEDTALLIGKQIDVFIDKDLTEYYVDLDSVK